jgi:hypothetical protein
MAEVNAAQHAVARDWSFALRFAVRSAQRVNRHVIS